MKSYIKKIAIAVMLIIAMIACTACGNYDMFDTVYTYHYAIVEFPDGYVEKIDIKQWKTYEDGEQIQIIAKDGTVYLVNSVNCALVKE